MTTLRIATRKSPLALWQAEFVAAALRAHHPGLEVELLPMSTRGDELLDRSLAAIGGKGLFLKELEEAMRQGRADAAVHSMKDVPADLPEGFEISAILERHAPHDAFVSNRHDSLAGLPKGARVGTSSLRRQAQLLATRPDLRIAPLRGNVNTRLAKLDADEHDAIILARAGLERLELGHRITEVIDPTASLPAVAQGALGIECLAGSDAGRLVAVLDHAETRACVEAERAMSFRLGGSCQVPLAGFCERAQDGALHLRALVGAPDGSRLIRAEERGRDATPEPLGMDVAEKLLAGGAGEIIAALGNE